MFETTASTFYELVAQADNGVVRLSLFPFEAVFLWMELRAVVRKLSRLNQRHKLGTFLHSTRLTSHDIDTVSKHSEQESQPKIGSRSLLFSPIQQSNWWWFNGSLVQ